MALGPTEAGRGRAIRISTVLIALLACLGAVVAHGASRAGGDQPGLAENAPVPAPAAAGPGNGQAVTPSGTLTMNETGVSQDACQGATLTLTLKSN